MVMNGFGLKIILYQKNVFITTDLNLEFIKRGGKMEHPDLNIILITKANIMAL